LPSKPLLLFIFLSLQSFAAGSAEKSILVLGDSLSSAYGMARERGWVALLEARLKQERLDYSVVNASISGDTSGGARARFTPLLDKHRPAIVVLELGGNDGLRGLPVTQMRTQPVGDHQRVAEPRGARAARRRADCRRTTARSTPARSKRPTASSRKRTACALVPFILEDFAGNPEYFQPIACIRTSRRSNSCWTGLERMKPLLHR
jgi:acyl-CoA thioesterase-1